ncbi:MAG TPA: MFS transporter [Smithellaceae bacterium]|jgi:UMF1 family MFS transporter|nr:MFS transporter [Smithellaceae bacterium]HOF77345.1 MFS transporter [Smithellaceae bacterium]HOM70297.1 MFS transporter [Smithellaceae bacterium]HOS08457.1 MFS transporter [Smithellaceae bacterium]HOU03824.1 MFS transporter [Smithellaceae bacterium]
MLDQKKSVISWAMYDWANSAFATTVMAGFFPIFFKEYWADPNLPQQSTFYLGMANSLASIIVAALAPFLGAVADRGSAKKKFLFFFAFLGVVMTGSLYMVAQGHWMQAVIFYVAATVGFSGGNIFYDSLITGVSSEKKMDFTSTLGFGLGYIGGGLLFLLNVLMFQFPAFFGISGKVMAIKLSFLSVAIWWAVFSIPLFLFVKEPKAEKGVPLFHAVVEGWQQLIGTLRDIRHLKVVGLFLLAYWFYIDGVDTIIRMAVDYGKSLGFDSGALIAALLMVQFIAFPAAILYGLFSMRIGTKKAIMIAICAYTLITVLAFFMTQKWHFFTLAACIGLFQGGIQALSRSLFTQIIPANKSAQFFGFFNMLGKFAVVFGPVMMGVITILTENVRYGILSVTVLFVAGGFLLSRVNIEEGKRVAKEYL